MRIHEICISGWKSYDTQGVQLSDLEKFNIIIGPNNIGKSNLIHYLTYLYYDFGFYQGYSVWKKGLKDGFSKENTWKGLGEEINCSIKVEDLEKDVFLCLEVEHTSKNGTKFKVKGDLNEQGILKENENYEENSEQVFECWKRLMLKFDHIATQRDYNRFSNNSQVGFDGSQLINEFEKISCDNHKLITSFLTDCLTDILGEVTIVHEIKIVEDVVLNRDMAKTSEYHAENSSVSNELYELSDDEISEKYMEELKNSFIKVKRIKFSLEQDKTGAIKFDLNQLGTGISQMVMVLCYIFFRTKIQKHENLLVFLEEPECNLHNDTLIKFIKLLNEKFNHQFFITTHSNALLECLPTSSNAIYRVWKTSEGSSKFSVCLKNLDKYRLLDDLGVTASQLLLSNCVIWIEGPSDRIYLKSWIEARSELREHVHFIFAMYGGSNLKSYTLLDEGNIEGWIQMLKSSRYVAIVADSDGVSISKPVKKYNDKLTPFEKIEKEIDASEELMDFCYTWRTNGKEIENYVPYRLLKEAIRETHKSRKYIQNFEVLKEDLELFTPFNKYFANMYKTKIGRRLTQKQKKAVADLIASKKVPISQYVSSKWKDEFVDRNKHLQEYLDGLINHIRKANKLSVK